jgi:hypothetical protein
MPLGQTAQLLQCPTTTICMILEQAHFELRGGAADTVEACPRKLDSVRPGFCE